MEHKKRIIAVVRQRGDSHGLIKDFSAVEAALYLKDKVNAEVLAVCPGSEPSISLLREAVGMGCGDALLIRHPFFNGCRPDQRPMPAVEAAVLAEALREMKYDILISGCSLTDMDDISFGFLLGELLQLPQAGCIEEAEYQKEEGQMNVKQRLEGRSQFLSLPLPCALHVIPDDKKRIYTTAEGIARAYAGEVKQKEITVSLMPGSEAELGGSVRLVGTFARKRGRRLLEGSAEELVSAVVAFMGGDIRLTE